MALVEVQLQDSTTHFLSWQQILQGVCVRGLRGGIWRAAYPAVRSWLEVLPERWEPESQ